LIPIVIINVKNCLYNNNQLTEGMNRAKSQNAVYIEYTSANGQCPT